MGNAIPDEGAMRDEGAIRVFGQKGRAAAPRQASLRDTMVKVPRAPGRARWDGRAGADAHPWHAAQDDAGRRRDGPRKRQVLACAARRR